jgi:hypothetical protein
MVPTPTMSIADHDLEGFDNLTTSVEPVATRKEHDENLSEQHTRTAMNETQQGWKGAKGRQQLLDCRSYGLMHFFLIHTVSLPVTNMI